MANDLKSGNRWRTNMQAEKRYKHFCNTCLRFVDEKFIADHKGHDLQKAARKADD